MTTMHLATRKALYRRLQAANPEPTTELLYNTPFELLVAVMLSAHTTDKSVNTATRKLFPVANTPQALLTLGEDGVKPYLKTVGLYNAKTRNLIGLCKQLIEKHGGEVPADREALEALPGVGRKTASVVLNMVFGQVEIAVDTHIFRVANRTGLAPGKNPRAVEDALMRNTPDEFKKNAHHWLLLHGRYVCTARLPACPKCIIKDLCEYPDKTPAPALKRSDAPIAHEKPHPMKGSGSTPTDAKTSERATAGKKPATRGKRMAKKTARPASLARGGRRPMSLK
jgi:endonuclease-3